MNSATMTSLLPSFFVVGPPRTGTTWIQQVLTNHVNLPSPTKETRFFDCHYHRGFDWYAKHFRAVRPHRPTGEVAPTYFASALARERIRSVAPDAKLVFVFRNPVERVVSLYRVKRAYGWLRWSFEEALERDPELLESSRYATQLQQWQDAFPESQLLVTLYDDLRESPQLYADRLFAFIGSSPARLSASDLARIHSSHNMTQPRSFIVTHVATAVANWCKARNLDGVVAAVRGSRMRKLFLGGGPPFPEVSCSTLEAITEIFQPEVEMLQRITGRDLSMWNLNGASALEPQAATTTQVV